jgi:uncharacterized protein (TIGR00369 family)
VAIATDRAELALAFSEPVVTVADVVHGGAIAALVDTAATAAAWATEELPEAPRGTTVAMSVSFMAAARAEDLTARARVASRGRTLCFCDVEVTGSGGAPVAEGLVTYKLG